MLKRASRATPLKALGWFVAMAVKCPVPVDRRRYRKEPRPECRNEARGLPEHARTCSNSQSPTAPQRKDAKQSKMMAKLSIGFSCQRPPASSDQAFGDVDRHAVLTVLDPLAELLGRLAHD